MLYTIKRNISFTKVKILLVKSSHLPINLRIFPIIPLFFCFCFVMASYQKRTRVYKFSTLHYVISTIELEFMVIIYTRARNISLIYNNFDNPFAIAVTLRKNYRKAAALWLVGWLKFWLSVTYIPHSYSLVYYVNF